MRHAVFFDLDDTLIDRTAAFGACVRALVGYRAAALDLPADEAAAAVLAMDEGGYRERRAFCRAVVERFPGLGPGVEDFWDEISGRVAVAVAPYDGALALLRDLHAAKLRVAVVTNGSTRTQRTKMATAGFPADLQAFVSGEVGSEKPDAGIFRAALAWAGCAPDEALFAGDHPVNDIAGAAAVGMETCWIAHGRTWREGPPPAHVVDRLASIRELLLP